MRSAESLAFGQLGSTSRVPPFVLDTPPSLLYSRFFQSSGSMLGVHLASPLLRRFCFRSLSGSHAQLRSPIVERFSCWRRETPHQAMELTPGRRTTQFSHG